MGKIKSTAVNYGINADNAGLRDDRQVRCWNCHQVVNLDRSPTSSIGSQIGDGVTIPATLLDGAVLAGATSITVDSTAGFATPDTGSITAFATGGSNITTVTSASHGLKGGKVIITSTTNYDGTYYIYNVTTNSFEIHIPFVADDATGTWTVPNYIYIYDVSPSASSMDKVMYTAIADGTTFTTATATVKAHADNMYVKGDATYSGCPFCGCLHYDQRR